MPVKEVALRGVAVPVPLHRFPKLRDPAIKSMFLFGRSMEILACGKKALHQERGFDQVASVVECAEYRHSRARIAIHIVRPGTVIALRRLQETHNLRETIHRFLTRNELSAGARHQSHNPEAARPRSDHPLVPRNIFACHPRVRIRTFPGNLKTAASQGVESQ